MWRGWGVVVGVWDLLWSSLTLEQKKLTNEWMNEKGVVISEVDLGAGIFFGAV